MVKIYGLLPVVIDTWLFYMAILYFIWFIQMVIVNGILIEVKSLFRHKKVTVKLRYRQTSLAKS